jgi:hypothetical protein
VKRVTEKVGLVVREYARDMYRVVESFLAAKTGHPLDCEDAILATETFAAIIDGATTADGGRDGSGRTWGRIASETCSAVLASLAPDATVDHALRQFSDALTTVSGPDDGPSATVVVFSAVRREVWRIGDTSFALDGRPHPPPPKEIDSVLSRVRALELQTQLAEGATVQELRARDPGREMITPLLQRMHVFRNRLGEWGFGAVSARPTPEKFIERTKVPAHTSELVLCSDGYPSPSPTLEEAEDDLARKLGADPLCISVLRSTKGVAPDAISFDDRAYLRLAV